MSWKRHKMTKDCQNTRFFKSAPRITESNRNWSHWASDTIRSQKSTPKSRSFLVGLLKKENFLSIRCPGMSRKKRPQKSEWRGILTTEGSVFGQFHEMAKKWQKKGNYHGRVSYVISKKNTFCQTGVPECLVKTTSKIRMGRKSYNKKAGFWPISRDVKKVTKKWQF